MGGAAAALGGYPGPWTVIESHSPHVGAFRDFPCELEANVCFHVLSGPRVILGARASCVRASILGRVAERRAHVRGDLLGIARVVAAKLGAAGRITCGYSSWDI